MKNPFRSTVAVLGLFAAVAGLSAQPALNVATVDMQRLYTGYYKAEASTAKLKEDDKKAKDALDAMVKQRDVLVTDAKALQEQSKNTILSDDARKRAEEDLQKKVGEIQKTEQEIQEFAQNTQRTLQGRMQRDQQAFFEEISKVASEIAKKKGVTLLLNKGADAVVVYTDAAYDISDEVLAAINKDRPTPAISLTPAK